MMNERIKELEKQSVFYNEDEEIWETDLEKFAELIVRECADISRGIGEHGHIASQEMLDHFGMK